MDSVIVYAIGIFIAAYFIRKFYLAITGKGGCSGCSSSSEGSSGCGGGCCPSSHDDSHRKTQN